MGMQRDCRRSWWRCLPAAPLPLQFLFLWLPCSALHRHPELPGYVGLRDIFLFMASPTQQWLLGISEQVSPHICEDGTAAKQPHRLCTLASSPRIPFCLHSGEIVISASPKLSAGAARRAPFKGRVGKKELWSWSHWLGPHMSTSSMLWSQGHRGYTAKSANVRFIQRVSFF